MSLTLGAATSDRVDVGGTDLLIGLTTFTSIRWHRPTTWTATRRVFETGTSANAARKRLVLAGSGATQGNLSGVVTRATTNTDFDVTDTPLATLNQWYCTAWTYDENANPSVVVYVGDLLTLAVARAVTMIANGAGGTTTEGAGGLIRLGNISSASPVQAFQGEIGVEALFNRVLSLGEVQSWQFAPRMMAGCVGLWRLGDTGVAAQPDYSGGGNAGTVTGATQADNPPLRRWRRAGSMWVPTSVGVSHDPFVTIQFRGA